jgi:hypothetical protein
VQTPSMNRTDHEVEQPRPPRLMGAIRIAQAAVATLLLGITVVTVAGHAAQAMAGTVLVFSQDDMRNAEGVPGPAPMQGDPGATPLPAEGTVGATQFVDIGSIALTLAGGLIAGAGAIMLARRSRWSVPLGLAGMAVVAIVGAFPALLGIWAASFYGMTSAGQLVPYLAVSAVPVGAAIAGMAMIWRQRAAIGPA